MTTPLEQENREILEKCQRFAAQFYAHIIGSSSGQSSGQACVIGSSSGQAWHLGI